MDVLPAIDLYRGQAVRLHQGRYDEVTVYDNDPANIAARLKGKVPFLHVVDLEGARAGHVVQGDLVRAIAEAFGEGVEVGGGVRTEEAAVGYFDLGVSRVVLGTAAIRDLDLVKRLAARYPQRIVVAVDAKDGLVATDGWEQVSTKTAVDVARSLQDVPICALLYTDVARDGTQVGPNMAATAALARDGGHPVIASGGVGALSHLRELAKLPGVTGAIVGKALYEKTFSLEEAILAAQG